MKLVVYKNQYGFTTLAKNGDDKMYISVQFRKGTEPEGGKIEIDIKDAFFSCYKDKEGKLNPKLVIMEYTTAFDVQIPMEDINISDSELPF